MIELLGALEGSRERIRQICELGLNHEEQHQELLLMDIKHVLSLNPLCPAYREGLPHGRDEAPPLEWIEQPAGLCEIGHPGPGFAFDNEGPRHQVFLRPFALASRLVTNGEYRTFVEDGGYGRADLWLSDGWAAIQEGNWDAPLYWERGEEGWREFTLGGLRPLDDDAPVCHLSYYEAEAYAAWADERLPTEAEWEVAAAALEPEGNFLESGRFHPAPALRGAAGAPLQVFGDLWEWTRSPYTAYPGYRPPEGALGEYNGKFMCNQMVLRGGACVTPEGHIRATYRNFFYPHQRWPFTGLRLARDLD